MRPSHLCRILLSILLTAAWAAPSSAAPPRKPEAGGSPFGATAKAGEGKRLKPTVILPVKHDLSPRLDEIARRIKPAAPNFREFEIDDDDFDTDPSAINQPGVPDPVVQDWKVQGLIPNPDVTFAGLSNADNAAAGVGSPTPPDTNGDIGPNHYFQTVNLIFAIYNRAGLRLLGPLRNNAVFLGFGGVCETTNTGDPVVLYDHLANRWMLSQFGPTSGGSYHQCVAVSQTADPLGAWYRYDFPVPSGVFNDYPKFGVWPDAYYMSAGGRGIPGPATDVFAYERAQMLTGGLAQMVWFRTTAVPEYVTPTPVDLDGPPPPAGTPNYFVGVKQSLPQAIYLFRFHVDWTTPLNSTFGLNTAPNDTITSIAPFTLLCPATRDCIRQPPPATIGLDALSGRYVMFRAQYRNFGTHESIVFNHTVDAGSGRAGVRWYEVRDPGGSPTIFQQGTYAPADGINRWMGSAAMDRFGNLAVGFSASSTTVFPSIYYAGRVPSDPAGILGQGEATLVAGAGVQNSTGSRWGDYSMMGVDPVDDCTFWYTTEYYATTSTSGWVSRIGSFHFPNCLVPDFSVSAVPPDVTVPVGNSAPTTITVQSINGFSSLVSLSCVSAAPAGIGCSFNPPGVTPAPNLSAPSTLTVSVATGTAPGTYWLLVYGTSGSVTRSAKVGVTVTP